MTNLRVRAFVPALFFSLFILLLNVHAAFSQESLREQPGQAKTTNGDARPEDESLRPSFAANTSATMQLGAHETSLSPLPRVSFISPREAEFGTVSSLRVEVNFKPATESAMDSNSRHPAASGSPQTAAARTPRTPGQKMRRAFKSAFFSPRAYLFSGVSAAITEATEDDLSHKETGDRVADGLSRFAIKFGTRTTRTLLSSGVYASLFRQDPRYYRSTQKNIAARAFHAASRVFVTKGDNGKLQPNYSRLAASLSASAISNLWEQSTPGRDRIGVDATFSRFGTSLINDAVFNVVNEFLPDLIKIFKK